MVHKFKPNKAGHCKVCSWDYKACEGNYNKKGRLILTKKGMRKLGVVI